MALPTDTRALGNLVTSTLDNILTYLTDDFFNTNPLWMRLMQRNEAGEGTIETGGAEIKVPIVYNKMPAKTYGRGATFGTGQTEFMTPMQFQYRRAEAECNLDGGDVALNAAAGERQLFNLVETTAKNAWMSLCDLMGYQMYSTADDGTGKTIAATPGVDDWDGIYNAVDNSTGTYTTYGAIARATTRGTPGGAINAQVINAQSSPVSTSLLQLGMGKATFNNKKPDLGMTTQEVWNDLANRLESARRYEPGPLAKAGFNVLQYNGMEIIADSHIVGAGAGNTATHDFWGLNTEFLQLYLLKGRDFVSRAQAEGFGKTGFPVYNQDAYVNQIIAMGNLVSPGPRFHFHISTIKVSA